MVIGKMDYRISEIDDAIRAVWTVITGKIPPSRRTILIQYAAAEMFRTRRPEDRHSEVMRLALTDLNNTGAFINAEWDVED